MFEHLSVTEKEPPREVKKRHVHALDMKSDGSASRKWLGCSVLFTSMAVWPL